MNFSIYSFILLVISRCLLSAGAGLHRQYNDFRERNSYVHFRAPPCVNGIDQRCRKFLDTLGPYSSVYECIDEVLGGWGRFEKFFQETAAEVCAKILESEF